MSYITNLVQRTLGVTPVAQPVIQARFAPQSRALAAGVQDSSAAQVVAPVSRFTHSHAYSLATTETGQMMPQPGMIDALPEAARAREGQSIVSMRQTESAEPALADLVANERETALPPAVQFDFPKLVPPIAPSVPVEAQSQELSDRHQNAAQPGDDFRLMKAAPAAQATQGFAPPAYSPAILRSRDMESVERPVVRVHIGRVDVRMVTTGTKEPRAAIPTG